jgi:hypothetical protein
MEKQNYKNHLRFYTPHHFVFYPVMIAGMAWGAWHIYTRPEQRDEWIALTAIFCILAWLSFMLRQHYALINQDRTVRLEMRLRYFRLSGKAMEPLEQVLTFKQIAALRFAADEELLPLVQKTVDEKLTPTAIKKTIKNWTPDDMRV